MFESVDDQLSNITLEYREDSVGELEDDIIQEIVIGRTSFNMPGQGLAGYSSGSNEGLFGIKVRSQIGPLSLTTIASIEQVETQKKDIDLTASNRDIEIGESRMQRNLFFFLDEVYRLKYFSSFVSTTLYDEYLKEKGWGSDPSIKTISVYKRYSGTSKPNTPNKEYDWAQYESNGGADTVTSITSIFEKLVEDKDYFIDNRKGTIRFVSPLSQNDVIGIYFEDTDGLLVKGSLNRVAHPSQDIKVLENLWILKNDENLTAMTDSTYYLMMRNVYSLPSTTSTPNFTITRKVGTENEAKTAEGVYYGQILGLMNENEDYDYENQDIFDLANGYVFFPPYDSLVTDTLYSDKTALNPFSNRSLGSHLGETNWGTIIYDDKSTETWPNRFSMITTNKEKQTNFTLDFGVMKDSETLTIGGTRLIKNEDYSIDYSMGYVSLLSDRSKSATQISAEYQKESLFFLDKKVFLGVNGRVDLPNIGRNSYFGTTVMWQLMDAKSLMPKVGTEPFDRFLFDTNLELDFQPEWMTSFTNLVPGVSTNANSSARFSVEVAHSKATNSSDTDGEAYIDNFSTSARNFALRIDEDLWSKASPDFGWTNNTENNILWAEHTPAWASFWFRPLKKDKRSKRTEIFPPRLDGNGQELKDEFLSTLRFVVQPYPKSEILRSQISEMNNGVKTSLVKPWAGITYGLNGSLTNRRNDRYFEFWVRRRSWVTGGYRTSGELIVDLGQVSEDISLNGFVPNRQADFELVNAVLTNETDLGIDTKEDSIEIYIYPNFSSGELKWDTLTIADSIIVGTVYGSDPAHDNWKKYDGDSNMDSRFINGTQGNYENKIIPDNEDANNDGIVYPNAGHFFRYKIDLSEIENSEYYSPEDQAYSPDSGWVKIRIPIGDNATFDMLDSTVGQPSWEQISHVRFLWHQFDSSIIETEGYLDTLEFAELNFVGNIWRELVTDSSDVGKVTATIEDSRSTSGYYRPMKKETEQTSPTEEATDYTLILDFKGIYRDSTVVAFRDFSSFQALDLTRYSDIRFWAEDLDRQITTSRDSWLTYRFGENDSTYYEFKTRRLIDDTSSVTVNNGWHSDDGIVVDLLQFTDLKSAQFANNGERVNRVDTAIVNSDGDTIRIFSKTEQMPSIASIKWMAFGVANHAGADYIGQLRINGLRAGGMQDRDGWALRSSMDLQFADFIKTNVNYQYTDADFRSMSQDIHSTSSSQVRSGVSGEMQLSKFIPDRAGIRLPFGASVNASLDRPEMRSNSDISLRQDGEKADGMTDMIGDFWDLLRGSQNDSTSVTTSEQYQTTSKDYRIFTSYRKTATSENPAVNLTADRIGVEYSYSVREGVKRSGYIPNRERNLVQGTSGNFHIAETEQNNQSFTLDYDLSPSRKAQNTISWQPFRESSNRSIPRKIKSMKLQLLPKTFDFDLIRMNYDWSNNYNSNFEARDTSGTYTRDFKENLGVNHKFEFNYEPLYPFTAMNLTVNSQRNFDTYLKSWSKSGVDNFVNDGLFSYDETWKKYRILNMENSRNHSTSFRFTPDLFTWLTPSATLSSNYSQNVDMISDTSSYMKGSLNSSFNSNLTFRVRRVFENMGKWGDGGWSKSMKFISSGLDAVDLESFILDYNAKMAVNSSYLDTTYLNNKLSNGPGSYYAYTIGLYDRDFTDIISGKMDDSTSFGGVQDRLNGQDSTDLNRNDTRKTSQTFGGRTSIKFPFASDISIDQVSLRWSRNYTIFQTYGKMDTSITWPEVRVSGSTPILRKIPTIDKYFSSFNFRTGFRYSKTVGRTSPFFLGESDTSSEVTQNVKYSYALDPLVKVDGVLKRRRIDVGYSLGVVFDTTERSNENWIVGDQSNTSDISPIGSWQSQSTSGIYDVTFNNIWTAGYKIAGEQGRSIKLFRGNEMELKGDIRFSAQVDLKAIHHRTNDETQGNKVDWRDSYLNITPRVEYDFTRKIGFSIFYSLHNQTVGIEQKSQHEGILAGELKITF